MRRSVLLILVLTAFGLQAQTTWVDSMDRYVREAYMPAGKYVWTWQRAALLRSMVCQYEIRPDSVNPVYLDYVKQAMDATQKRAHGKRPNAVASGHGMAFLYRITGEQRYKTIADRIFRDYLDIIRVPGGGVSHKAKWPELWDDTIYMIGVFLLEMFRATGEERYLGHFMEELRIHRERLRDEQWGLWVHGWDGDSSDHIAFCGQKSWPDEHTRKSSEIWGRGNGWVVVTISDALKTVPGDHPYYAELVGYLVEMIVHLPDLQDEATGHWYQLPVRKGEPGNFIESSCTAMFGYGILTALEKNLVSGPKWTGAVESAYYGLRNHSVVHKGGAHLTSANVCKGTCIGDKAYYYNRKVVEGKPFGLAMFILFGLEYERWKGIR